MTVHELIEQLMEHLDSEVMVPFTRYDGDDDETEYYEPTVVSYDKRVWLVGKDTGDHFALLRDIAETKRIIALMEERNRQDEEREREEYERLKRKYG